MKRPPSGLFRLARRPAQGLLLFYTFFGALCVITSVLVTSLYKDQHYKRQFHAQQISRTSLLGESLAQSLAKQLYFDERGRIRHTLTQVLGAHPDIQDTLVVRRRDNRVVFDLMGEKTGAAFSDTLLSAGLRYVRSPIDWTGGQSLGLRKNKVRLGDLYLGVALGDPQQNLQVQAMVDFAQDIARQGAQAMEEGRWVELGNVLADFSRSKSHVLYSQLLLTDGQVVFNARRGQNLAAAKRQEGHRTTDSTALNALAAMDRLPVRVTPVHLKGYGDVMDIAVSLWHKGKSVGLLRLGYGLESLKREQHRARWRIGLLAVLLVGLAATAASLVSFRMSTLVKQLDHSNHSHRTSLEEKQAELMAGREVQRAMLPPLAIDTPPLKIFCHFQPASELCGDFFDILVEENFLVIFMADVSGHGAGAAMVTMALKGALPSAVREQCGSGETPNPSRILVQLDAFLSENTVSPDRHYVTAICAVYHLPSHTLRLARAGHPPPWVWRKSETPTQLPGPALPPLNLHQFLKSPPADATVDVLLAPGMKVLMHTDGLTEVFSPEGDWWGEEGLGEMLAREGHLPAEALLRRLSEATIAFSHSRIPRDDQAMVMLEWPG